MFNSRLLLLFDVLARLRRDSLRCFFHPIHSLTKFLFIVKAPINILLRFLFHIFGSSSAFLGFDLLILNFLISLVVAIPIFLWFNIPPEHSIDEFLILQEVVAEVLLSQHVFLFP